MTATEKVIPSGSNVTAGPTAFMFEAPFVIEVPCRIVMITLVAGASPGSVNVVPAGTSTFEPPMVGVTTGASTVPPAGSTTSATIGSGVPSLFPSAYTTKASNVPVPDVETVTVLVPLSTEVTVSIESIPVASS